MDRQTVPVDCPRELVRLLDVPEDNLGDTLLLLAVLELVRETHISSGKAAELLGLSKAAFIDQMGQHDVPYFTETAEELAAQLDALRDLDDDEAES